MDVYESLIDKDEEIISKGDPNKKGHQGPPDYPYIDEIIDNSDEERAANSYDKYIGSGVVLTNWKGEKLIWKVR